MKSSLINSIILPCSIYRGVDIRSWNYFRKLFSILLVSLFISACGESVSNSNADNFSEDSGELVISLTDAEGDLIAYEVTLRSILLERFPTSGNNTRNVIISSFDQSAIKK